MTHDALCRNIECDCEPDDYGHEWTCSISCQCSLIKRVRKDERKRTQERLDTAFPNHGTAHLNHVWDAIIGCLMCMNPECECVVNNCCRMLEDPISAAREYCMWCGKERE
jgi:hypothetical protein